MSSKGDINRRGELHLLFQEALTPWEFFISVLAIQAKKKRKNPKGRKSSNLQKDETVTPSSGTAPNLAASGNSNSRETRSTQPR